MSKRYTTGIAFDKPVILDNGTSISTVEIVNRLNAMEWISVEDALPENDNGSNSIPCLVLMEHNDIGVRPYNQYHICWDDEDGDDYFTEARGGKVLAWMYLPKNKLHD